MLRLNNVRRHLAEVMCSLSDQTTIEACLERVPHVNSQVWVPFPLDPPERIRRVRILEMPSIGHGAFGIVFAVIIEVAPANVTQLSPQEALDNPFVVMAAMKMAPILKDHCKEVINGLAVNDIVRSGCTPCAVRLIDAFCISTASTETACRMPPMPHWTGTLWKPFDTFVYERRGDIEKAYGKDSMREGYASGLNSGATIGFTFTELAPRFLLELTTTRSAGSEIRAEDDRADMASRGIRTSRDLVNQLYLHTQAISGFHCGGLLHKDISLGNFVSMSSCAFRTSYCTLESRHGFELRTQFLGVPGHTRPDDTMLHTLEASGKPLVFRTGAAEGDTSVAVIDSVRGMPVLLDFGKSGVPTFAEEALTQKTFAAYILGPEHATHPSRDVLPLVTTFSHGKSAFASNNVCSPAMQILDHPTTAIDTRCFEQFNPFIFEGLDGRIEYQAKTPYLSFYSSLSEVYSLGAMLAHLILGYAPFSNTLRVTVPQPKKNKVLGATNLRSRGPHAAAVASDNPNRDLNSSNNRVQLELRYSPFRTIVEESSPMISLSEMNAREPATRTATDPSEDRILHCKPLRPDAYSLRSYLLKYTRESATRSDKPCHFFDVGSQDTAAPDNASASSLHSFADGILARIDAVGLCENIENLRGTLLYDYLKDLKKNVFDTFGKKDEKRTGWLLPALYDTLTKKWGIESILAKDYAHRLRDALSMDPAERPSLERLMNCDLFKQMLFGKGTMLSSVFTLWSSIRPSLITSVGEFLDDRRFANLHKTVAFSADLFMMAPAGSRDLFGAVAWAGSAYYNAARLQCFQREYMASPGFFMCKAHTLPRLMSEESGMASVYNCKTGVLDYFTGTPCVLPGSKKATIFKDDRLGDMVIFESTATRERYMRRIVSIADADPDDPTLPSSVPSWIFGSTTTTTTTATDTDNKPTEELVESGSITPTSPSKKRPRDLSTTDTEQDDERKLNEAKQKRPRVDVNS